MNLFIVTTVDGIEVIAFRKCSHFYLPFPILCKALHVDVDSQLKVIKKHRMMRTGLIVHSFERGDDFYDVPCIILEYAYAWLFLLDFSDSSDIKQKDFEWVRRILEGAFLRFASEYRPLVEPVPDYYPAISRSLSYLAAIEKQLGEVRKNLQFRLSENKGADENFDPLPF